MAGPKNSRKTVHALNSDETPLPATSESYVHIPIQVHHGEEQLPLYSKNEPDIWPSIENHAAILRAEKSDQDPLPILAHPKFTYDIPSSRIDIVHRQIHIVSAYFNAIRSGKIEVVAKFWGSGLVTTETTNEHGRTPLLTAVEAEHTHMVRYLLDVGVEIDNYGIMGTTMSGRLRWGKEYEQHTYRTPLQLAASIGNLAIVKLLIERGADDSFIAPDGQLALRLAATNGHREIVEYLPSRRGGGFRRWKAKHATAMHRCERAALKIYDFAKVIVWDIPRFFIWSIPKHLLVLPLIKGMKWLYAHRNEIPALLAGVAKDVAIGLQKLPKQAWQALKELPAEVWACVKKIAKFIWRSIKRLPHGMKIALVWLWGGIKGFALSVANLFAHFCSLIHTVCSAVANFFQRITLRDVANAFIYCLHAIFIDLPKRTWEWICKFGKTSLKVLEAIFGGFGCCIWYLIRCMIKAITYIPEKIWEMLMACGSSMRSGGKEVLVWIDPKRV